MRFCNYAPVFWLLPPNKQPAQKIENVQKFNPLEKVTQEKRGLLMSVKKWFKRPRELGRNRSTEHVNEMNVRW